MRTIVNAYMQSKSQSIVKLAVIYCTFNIGQSNKEVCFHFNSQPCSQAVIIFDADYLKYKQRFQ